MNINVPESAIAHFWVEPPPDSIEFWKMRFPPPCKMGETLWFRYQKVIIASAIVSQIIHRPRNYTDDKGVTFGPGFYIYWQPESFVDRRGKP